MAKRRKKAHHTTRRRRRVSGISAHGMTGDLMELVGLVGGSVITTVAQRQLSSVSPKILAAGGIVAGIMLKRHAKSPLMHGMSYGIMGASAIALAHDFRIIAGVEDFVNGMDNDMQGLEDAQYMHGIDNERKLSGFNNESKVSGDMMSGAYMG